MSNPDNLSRLRDRRTKTRHDARQIRRLYRRLRVAQNGRPKPIASMADILRWPGDFTDRAPVVQGDGSHLAGRPRLRQRPNKYART